MNFMIQLDCNVVLFEKSQCGMFLVTFLTSETSSSLSLMHSTIAVIFHSLTNAKQFSNKMLYNTP